MIELLSRWLIQNRGDTRDPAVRRAYGALCGGVGIALNVLLFLAKYAAGIISGSIAVTADAFNNLSDAGTSAVTLIGFRMSGKRDDDEHPYGHGRAEYVAGLIVAMVVVLMGFELGRSAVEKILSPQPPAFHPAAVAVMALSVLVKLYMFLYNRRIGARIRSVAMRAAATDSLSDACATATVLASMLAARFLGWNIDGWVGALVALLILWGGVTAARDAISPLLGNPPDEEFVRRVEAIAASGDQVLGVHDLRVHDYGAGRVLISLHVEVPANGDLMQLHDMVDGIERRLREALNCEAVIHLDPTAGHGDQTDILKQRVLDALKDGLDPRVTVHDFRVLSDGDGAALSFDAVVPRDRRETDGELANEIRRLAAEAAPGFGVAVTVDRPYEPLGS